MNTIKLTDITGKEVEIDAKIIASKIEEISETNGLACSETEWLIDSIKNYEEKQVKKEMQKEQPALSAVRKRRGR